MKETMAFKKLPEGWKVKILHNCIVGEVCDLESSVAVFPKQEWYEAIKIRKSRRHYKREGLPDNLVSHIRQLCTEFTFPEARAELVLDDSGDIFKGALGSYGKIKGSPAYVAFIGNSNYPHYNERVGYLGEGIILECTQLGLATCWVGGFFRPEAVAKQIGLNTGEKVLAVTPVGYAEDGYSIEEKLLSGMAKSKNRKELKELAKGLERNEWPLWVSTALEAARLAPSAVNRQPWRFLVNPERVTVLLDSEKDSYNIPKRLDCGIAMLHLELGALAGGVIGSWQFLNGQGVATFTVESTTAG